MGVHVKSTPVKTAGVFIGDVRRIVGKGVAYVGVHVRVEAVILPARGNGDGFHCRVGNIGYFVFTEFGCLVQRRKISKVPYAVQR